MFFSTVLVNVTYVYEASNKIQVSSPSRASAWVAGNKYLITWAAPTGNEVFIRLAKADTMDIYFGAGIPGMQQKIVVIELLEHPVKNTGSFTWNIEGGFDSGLYVIVVALNETVITNFGTSEAFQLT